MTINRVLRTLLMVMLSMALAVGMWGVMPTQRVAAEACSTAGDYRTAASGNWNATATWEYCDGADWVAASATPTSADGAIAIRNGHTVTVTANVTVDQVAVESGGQVTINSGITWTIAAGDAIDLNINGTVENKGTFTVSTGATWTLNAGATFIHNAATAIAMSLSRGTLNATSTFIYRGSSTLTPFISISGRTYGHLIMESTSGVLTLSSTSGGSNLTINGNFSIGATGSGTVTYSTVGFTGQINISGNLNIGNGSIFRTGASTTSLGGNLNNSGILGRILDVSAGGNFSFDMFGASNPTINVVIPGTLTNLQVDRIDSDHPNATGTSGGSGIKTGKYWTITPAGSDYTVHITLPHNISPDTNAYVCKYPGQFGGAGWDCARTSSDATTVTRENITSFSDWAVGNNVAPTAVTVSGLSATSPFAALAVGLLAAAGLVILRKRK